MHLTTTILATAALASTAFGWRIQSDRGIFGGTNSQSCTPVGARHSPFISFQTSPAVRAPLPPPTPFNPQGPLPPPTPYVPPSTPYAPAAGVAVNPYTGLPGVGPGAYPQSQPQPLPAPQPQFQPERRQLAPRPRRPFNSRTCCLILYTGPQCGGQRQRICTNFTGNINFDYLSYKVRCH